MEEPMELSLTEVFYGKGLRKSPNFADAEIEPSRNLGISGASSAKLKASRETIARGAEESKARIAALAGITPEIATQIDPHIEALNAEREDGLREAHAQFGHDRAMLARAARMVHDRHDRGMQALMESMRRPELPVEKEDTMERSLLDVFYGRKLRKAKRDVPGENPDDEDPTGYEDPGYVEYGYDDDTEPPPFLPGKPPPPPPPVDWSKLRGDGHDAPGENPAVRTAGIGPQDDHSDIDHLADYPDFDDGLYDFDGVEMDPAERANHEDNRESHRNAQPLITEAKQRRKERFEDEERGFERHLASYENYRGGHVPEEDIKYDDNAEPPPLPPRRLTPPPPPPPPLERSMQSFAKQRESFQKSVPFPMQMRYGPISPTRRFSR